MNGRTSFSFRASYLVRRKASFSGVMGNTFTWASVKSFTTNKCLQKGAYPSFRLDSSYRSLTILVNSSTELELEHHEQNNALHITALSLSLTKQCHHSLCWHRALQTVGSKRGQQREIVTPTWLSSDGEALDEQRYCKTKQEPKFSYGHYSSVLNEEVGRGVTPSKVCLGRCGVNRHDKSASSS